LYRYDGNQTFVRAINLHLYKNTYWENIFDNYDTPVEDVVKDGIDYSACLKHRPEFDQYLIQHLSIYTGDEAHKDCSEAMAKSCLFENSGYSDCRYYDQEYFAQPEVVSINVDLGESIGGPIDDDYKTRCMRKTNDTEIATNYEKFRDGELSIAPETKLFTYDKTTNTFTNTINGHTYQRFVDNNDGTFTDNMSKVTFIKDIYSLDPFKLDNYEISNSNSRWVGLYTWQESLDALKAFNESDENLGGNWRLVDKEDIFTIRDIKEYFTIDKFDEHGVKLFPENNFYDYWNNAWTQRDYEFDSTKAYTTGIASSSIEPEVAGFADKTETRNIMLSKRENMIPIIKYPNSDTATKIGTSFYTPDMFIPQVMENTTFELDATGSYKGINPENVKFKWEYVVSKNEGIQNPPTITNADKEVAIVSIPELSESIYENKFKLTMTKDGTDEKKVAYIFVSFINSNVVKLDADGNELPYSAATWACVWDKKSNLVWEAKQSSEDIIATVDFANINSLKPTYSCGTTWRTPKIQDINTVRHNPDVYNLSKTMGSNRVSDAGGNKEQYWITFDEISHPLNDNSLTDLFGNNSYGWTASRLTPNGVYYADDFEKTDDPELQKSIYLTDKVPFDRSKPWQGYEDENGDENPNENRHNYFWDNEFSQPVRKSDKFRIWFVGDR
jgi:hypothetical protein